MIHGYGSTVSRDRDHIIRLIPPGYYVNLNMIQYYHTGCYGWFIIINLPPVTSILKTCLSCLMIRFQANVIKGQLFLDTSNFYGVVTGTMQDMYMRRVLDNIMLPTAK